uniref:Ovule protein n=1 Tax=Gongylonema pulchrum TaxID=637853 RepID=A0A183F0Y6_9BILA
LAQASMSSPLLRCPAITQSKTTSSFRQYSCTIKKALHSWNICFTIRMPWYACLTGLQTQLICSRNLSWKASTVILQGKWIFWKYVPKISINRSYLRNYSCFLDSYFSVFMRFLQ